MNASLTNHYWPAVGSVPALLQLFLIVSVMVERPGGRVLLSRNPQLAWLTDHLLKGPAGHKKREHSALISPSSVKVSEVILWHWERRRERKYFGVISALCIPSDKINVSERKKCHLALSFFFYTEKRKGSCALPHLPGCDQNVTKKAYAFGISLDFASCRTGTI